VLTTIQTNDKVAISYQAVNTIPTPVFMDAIGQNEEPPEHSFPAKKTPYENARAT
jgi:hypothetical protein